MKTITRGNFSYAMAAAGRVTYPIVVAEDTEYRGVSFHQQEPHTAGIFSIVPGVTLRLVNCNLLNVTVPDGVVVEGGLPHHAVRVPIVGNPDRDFVDLFCECLKCVTAQGELEDIRALPEAEREALKVEGRWLHANNGGALKARYVARRANPTKVTADRARQAAANAALMTKYGGGTINAALRTRLKRGA